MSSNLHSVLMIRPCNFRVNQETLENNFFQTKSIQLENDFILNQAIIEFDSLVKKMKASGINVLVYQDDFKHDTPDSIFPNNWVTFHKDKKIAIYPMFAENRRLERSENVIVFLEENNVKINEVIDYSEAEKNNFFLEFDKVWVHGFLHLLGYNHIKNKDYFKMHKIEKRILNSITQ